MIKNIGVILIIAIFFIYSFLLFADEVQKRSEMINFSHQLHIEDAEMECVTCHSNIEESTKANDDNFPEKDICAECHDVEDDENCNMCHVDLDIAEELANPARKILFNHKAHLALNEGDCAECHAGIEKVAMGDGTKIPSQEKCNSCHNGLSASKACLICHSSETKFRPDNHNPFWSKEHMVEIRSGETDCAHCHTNNYCQQCHESTDLISTKILPKNFYAPLSPTANSEKPLVLQAVHELNYRFIHQLDAFGKSSDCSICHETSTYCSECHDASDINSQNRPNWHDGPDWGALAAAVGSGGGRHAELARRDMERCAACHDVQGADPVCLMCHIDYDGVKNTDPKTHGPDFSDRFGDSSEFHNDDGAICFFCHTNTHQKGFGFCGYCHN